MSPDDTPFVCEPVRREDGVVVLELSGELVVTNREELRRCADAELANGARSLVLSIAGLSHVDTSGLALFVQLSNQCAGNGCRLAVAGLGSYAEVMRQSLFLDEAVLFADDVEDAVAALSG